MSLISGNENKIFAKGVIGNVRKAQEDSHGWKLGTPNGDLFVVCDGMGGHVGGATASRIAVDSIIEHIGKERYSTPIEALNGALQFANMQILGHAYAHPELKGMGTTACIVLVQDDGLWIAHVGDSRIYLYLGKEKQLHRITKDHSYVQTLVDAGEITDEEAEHHPNKNRIMKALGIKPELQPTFNFNELPILPKNGDIFLICSDGLSGMIPDHTIERVLGEENLTLLQKGDELIRLAMEGETVKPGGQDNCTMELIEIDNSKWKKSNFKSFNPNQTSEKQIRKDPAKLFKLLKVSAISILALLVLGAAVWWLMSYHKNNNVVGTQEIEKIKELEDANKKMKADTIRLQGRIKNLMEEAKQGKGSDNGSVEVAKIQSEITEIRGTIKNNEEEIEKLKNR